MKFPAVRWAAAAVVLAAVLVEGSMIRRQRRAAAAALAEERTEPPDPTIVSAPEIQVAAPRAATPRAHPPPSGQEEAQSGARYADLIRTLAPKVPAAQLANLRELLDAREHAVGDAMDAARAAGVDPGLAAVEIQRAVAQERATIDDRIKTEVGLAALAAVQQFDAAHPQADGPPPPQPDGDSAPPPPPDGPN